MALNRTAWQTAITDTSTTAQYELGTLREYLSPTYSWQIWRYVLNGEAVTALSAGLGVVIKSGATNQTGVISGAGAPSSRFLGVAQHTIAAGSYGWILCEGYGLIQSNGTTTAVTGQKPAANGEWTDGVVGTDDMPVCAIAANAVGGSDSLAAVHML